MRSELAWYKRLPKDVSQVRSQRNLAKVLIRICKLHLARACASSILSGYLKFKGVTRDPLADMADVIRQAASLRSLLRGFRDEMKFFGSEFVYDGLDLFEAFDNIHELLSQKAEQH